MVDADLYCSMNGFSMDEGDARYIAIHCEMSGFWRQATLLSNVYWSLVSVVDLPVRVQRQLHLFQCRPIPTSEGYVFNVHIEMQVETGPPHHTASPSSVLCCKYDVAHRCSMQMPQMMMTMMITAL